MRPIALISSYSDGTSVHIMSNDFERKYKTKVALYVPEISSDPVPVYNNLRSIPIHLQNGTNIAISRDGLKATPPTNSNVLNGFYGQNGQFIQIPKTVPGMVPGVVSPQAIWAPIAAWIIANWGALAFLFTVVVVAITAAHVVSTIANVIVETMNPPCGTETRLWEMSSKIALLQTPTCHVVTVDKDTGEIKEEVDKGVESPLESIKWIAIVGIIGIAGIMFLKMMMSSGSKSED